ASSTPLLTRPPTSAGIPNAAIASTKANATSAVPHHLGNTDVSFARPAPIGNTQDNRNRIKAAKAIGRMRHKVCTEDPIAIAQQIARRSLPRESLPELLGSPLRGRLKRALTLAACGA